MSKVILEHELLGSKNATFVALVNELLLWAEANDMQPAQIQHFLDGFVRDTL